MKINKGVVHQVPQDLKIVLLANKKLLNLWNNLTPLARNEWICWITIVKKSTTRTKHISRLRQDLRNGKKRPCCWSGCLHRTHI